MYIHVLVSITYKILERCTVIYFQHGAHFVILPMFNQIMYKVCLTHFTGDYQMSTLANSEDPDEILNFIRVNTADKIHL